MDALGVFGYHKLNLLKLFILQQRTYNFNILKQNNICLQLFSTHLKDSTWNYWSMMLTPAISYCFASNDSSSELFFHIVSP